MIKQKLLNLSIFISFLFCYIEWGHDGSEFIFQTEYEIFLKTTIEIQNLLHPFILIPFTGQLILLRSLFKKEVSKKLTIAGIVMTGVLVLFILAAGIFSGKLKMILSVVPFILFSVWAILAGRINK